MRYGDVKPLVLRDALIRRDWALDVAEAEEEKAAAQRVDWAQKLKALEVAEAALGATAQAQQVTLELCEVCEQLYVRVRVMETVCNRCRSPLCQADRLARYQACLDGLERRGGWAVKPVGSGVCEWCSGPFVRKRRGHRFCGAMCAELAWKARKRNGQKVLCLRCGAAVPFGSKRSKYCGEACNRAAKRERQTKQMRMRDRRVAVRLVTAVCPECKRSFEKRERSLRVYCTGRCYSDALNRREMMRRRAKKRLVVNG